MTPTPSLKSQQTSKSQQASNPSSASSNWLKRLAGVCLIVGITLAVVPFIVKKIIQSTLVELGAETVLIDDIDINLFTGQLGIEGLIIREKATTPLQKDLVSINNLHVDIALLNLLKKQILIEALNLNGVALHIEEIQANQYKIGFPLPAGDDIDNNSTNNNSINNNSIDNESIDNTDNNAAWGIGIDKTDIATVAIFFHSNKLSSALKIDNAQLTQIKSWEPDHVGQFNLKATLNDAPINITLGAKPFAEVPNSRIEIKLDQFNLSTISAFLPDNFKHFNSKLSLDLKTSIRLDNIHLDNTHLDNAHLDNASNQLNSKSPLHKPDLNTLYTSTSGSITINDTALTSDQFQLNAIDTHWHGTLSTVTALDTGQTEINHDATLTFNNLDLNLVQYPIKISNQQTRWQGTTQLKLHDIENTIKLKGMLSINQFNSQLTTSPIQLAQFKTLTLDSLKMDGLNSQRLETIDINQLTLFSERDNDVQETLINNKNLNVSNIQLNNLHQLAIDSIRFNGVESTIHINPDGKILIIEKVLAALGLQSHSEGEDKQTELTNENTIAKESIESDTTKTPATAQLDNSKAFQYRIQEISVNDSSQIKFKDSSVQPAFNTLVALDLFKIGPVDNANLHENTNVDLRGKVGEFSTLVASGSIQAFNQPKNGEFFAHLSNMELPPVSPYAARTIGYNLSSGQLNSEMKLSITNDALQGNNKLLVANLNIVPKDEEQIKKLTTKISMPLDLALSMLKNKEGDIEINMPIEGNLNDPKIKIGDVITNAMGHAIRKASLSYLKYTLQPYGTLITVVQKTAEHLNEVRLNPIEFQPNSILFDEEAKQYLDKIAFILDQRPELRIRLCSVSTTDDLNVYQEKLNLELSKHAFNQTDKSKPEEYMAELGRLRALSIKNHLIEQHQIDASRLFVCHPIFAKDNNSGMPRTELKI